MRIVVTGGSGNVGRYVISELQKSHEVIAFDREEPKNGRTAFVKGDILDIDDCKKAFKKAEVVVHLAAITSPEYHPPQIVISVNALGTFTVHQAAYEAGVEKVVHASSDASYGMGFAERPFFPDYLPLDEDHPQKPQDSYGLSKKMGEEIAASFTRKCEMTTIALRLSWVWFPEEVEYRIKQDGIEHSSICNALYYKQVTEEPFTTEGLHGLWSYNDARDVAVAFRLAVETKKLKHEIFLISAKDNRTKINSVDLLRKYCSDKIPFKKTIKGRQSLYDYNKATRLLGYKPRYTWQDIVSGSLCSK